MDNLMHKVKDAVTSHHGSKSGNAERESSNLDSQYGSGNGESQCYNIVPVNTVLIDPQTTHRMRTTPATVLPIWVTRILALPMT